MKGWLGWVAAMLPAVAYAGPPYITDDPEPTRTGGWENYAFVSAGVLPGSVGGEAGAEFNYGLAPGLQLSANLPLGFEAGGVDRVGRGDLQLGVKYRFWSAAKGSWLPDAAIYPTVVLPTGGRTFGSAHLGLFVPVWVQKDIGAWTMFGGGGYALNPGAGRRNYALVGGAVTRQVTQRLNLGLEIYHQSPAMVDEAGETNVGVGAIYQLSTHWAVMGSGGPTLRGAGRGAFYASVQFTD